MTHLPIERLRSTLASLRALPPDELSSPASEPVRRDCADALRLQLDCMQAELAPAERDALLALSDELERPEPSGVELEAALSVVARTIG